MYPAFVQALAKRLNTLFGINLASIAKTGVILNVGQAASMGFAFLINLFFARYVTADTIGEYRYLLSLLALFEALTLSGLAPVVTQAIANERHGTYLGAIKQIVRWSWIHLLIGGFTCAYFFIVKQQPLMGATVLFLALVTPLQDAALLSVNVLIGLKKYGLSAIRQASMSATQCATLIIITFIHPSAYALAIGSSLSLLFANSLWSLFTYKRLLQNTRLQQQDLEFAKHLSFSNFISALAAQADRLIVFHLLGAGALAIYSFATAVPKQVKAVTGFTRSVSIEAYAKKSPTELLAAVKKHFFISLFFLIPGWVIYALIAQHVYQLLFPGYVEAGRLSVVFALSLLILGNLAHIGLQTLREARYTHIVNLVNSISFIGFTWLGAYRHGLIGAMAGVAASRYLTAVTSYLLLKRAVKTERV